MVKTRCFAYLYRKFLDYYCVIYRKYYYHLRKRSHVYFSKKIASSLLFLGNNIHSCMTSFGIPRYAIIVVILVDYVRKVQES